MPKLMVNNIYLHYESYGKGPDLLLIGGLATNHTIWSAMIVDLAKHFCVTALDNRGVGQSSQPKRSYALDDMATDVAQFMDARQMESAFIVGHCMGGAILQKLCIHHKHKVKAAIIAASTHTLPQTTAIHIKSTSKLMKAQISRDLILETIFPWIYGHTFLENPNNIAAELIRIKGEIHPQTHEGYLGQMNSFKDYNTFDQLKTIECPTLVVAGQDDLLTPVKFSRLMANEIPNAKLEIIPQCGHMFHREQPQAFTKHIISFFTQATDAHKMKHQNANYLLNF
jgi:3-oxoadipate enol-lactonase